MHTTRWILFALLAGAALVPAAAPGETVRLRDSSSLRGRLVSVDGDTLTFRLSAGPTVRLHRGQILSIVFDDSAAAIPVPAPAAGVAPSGAPGTIELAFKDREVSSKISIEKKRDWEGHEQANQIVVQFLVDGVVAYADTDTTTDKRIYHGHVTQLKNDIKLADFKVTAPSGIRHAQLIVRSRGADEYRDAFDGEPLNMVLAFDNLDVRAGQVTRLDVGITRGKLRMGKARFFRVE
jgi:hypothetical protein